jgi:predicted NBD/HSP70 family sugar kinase
MSRATTDPGAPAGQRTVRQHNLRLVLAELASAPGSRAGLAHRTGLTKATVASLVSSLVEQAIVLQAEPTSSGPGRPSRSLSFNPDGPAAIGVEINVNYTAVCHLDLTGRTHHHKRVAVDNRAGSAIDVLAFAAAICRPLLDGLSQPALGVALAVPGVVGQDGEVLRAPNLSGLNGHHAGATLAMLLALSEQVPVIVENEANLGALAHLRSMPAQGQNFAYVSGEIGVGAGLVVEGELFRGLNGFAGELGHVVVERGGPSCSCGGQGCVEQYAGQEVMLRTAGQPDIEALQTALERREPRAVGAVENAGSALGVGLASLLNVLDLPTVVLGGMYARLFDTIVPPLQAELTRRVLSAQLSGPLIRRSALGADAAVRGAAGLVIDRALKGPDRFGDLRRVSPGRFIDFPHPVAMSR